MQASYGYPRLCGGGAKWIKIDWDVVGWAEGRLRDCKELLLATGDSFCVSLSKDKLGLLSMQAGH